MREIFSYDQCLSPLVIKIDNQEVPIRTFPSLTGEKCDELSGYYESLHHENMRVKPENAIINYVMVDCGTKNSSHQVEVMAPQEVETVVVHPMRSGIRAICDKTKVSFTIEQNVRRVIIKIDQYPILCLLFEKQIVKHKCVLDSISLLNYQSEDHNELDYSEVFHKAFEALNNTGKTLLIPKGIYPSDTISLCGYSNFNIFLEEGVLIKTLISNPGENVKRPGLWIHNSTNINIYGRGVLDHQSMEEHWGHRNNYAYGFVTNDYYQDINELGPKDPLRASPLLVTNCKNISFHDITIRNGRCWNISVKGCEHIIFNNIKVLSPPACLPEWADGFNFGSCRDVEILDCFVVCNDDTLAFAHNISPYLGDVPGSDNIKVKDFLGYTKRAQAVRFGWASRFKQGHYSIVDSDFVGCADILIRLENRIDKTLLDYESICFEACGFDGRPGIRIEGEADSIKKLVFRDVTWNG